MGTNDSLGDTQFSEEALAKFLGRKGADEPETALSAAAKEGGKPECVSHWCAEGFIAAEWGRYGGTGAWIIEDHAISDFQKN